MDKLNAAELIRASEDVQSFAAKVDAVTNLGKILGKIGSVKQAADEADAMLAKSKAEAVKAADDVERLKNEAKGLNAARERTLAAAQADATKLLNDATEAAGDVLAKARAHAKEVVESALAQERALLSTADAAVSEAKGKVAKATVELTEVEDAVVAARKELAETEAKIAAARAAIAKALG